MGRSSAGASRIDVSKFSVVSVIASALGNVASEHAEKQGFWDSVAEFIAYERMREHTASPLRRLLGEEEASKILEDCEDVSDLLRGIVRRCPARRQAALRAEIASCALAEALGGKNFFAGDVSAIGPFGEIANFFSLTEKDVRVVAFLACWNKTRNFDDLCDAVCGWHSISVRNAFIARAVGLRAPDVSAALRRLNERSLIERGGRRSSIPELVDTLDEYISEYDGAGIAERFSKTLSTKKTFPLDSFEVDARDVAIVSRLLSAPAGTRILLHGKPGSGKTEFAKALCVSLGRRVFVPARDAEKEKRNALKSMSIRAAARTAKLSGGIALIDEADDFIETKASGFLALFAPAGENAEKGAVNTLLDELDGVSTIWISNSISGVAESTRRRFDYTLEFPGVSDRQKRIVLAETMRRNRVPAKFREPIFEIVRQYSLSPAGIALAVRNAKTAAASEAELLDNVRLVAKRHYKFMTGREPTETAFSCSALFDARFLNTTPTTDAFMKQFEGYREACSKAGKLLPAAMLFSGLPGTGKTELGRHVAKALGRELLVKRMSDLESPYVGVTEQKIAAAFAEAKREGFVLMIDEADSLFTERRDAARSWEVSRTNETLAQMERFEGLVICTTNLVGKMDSAAMRRFAWKVEFRALEPETAKDVFLRYFPRERGADELRALSREFAALGGLCPGDFKAVADRFRYAGTPTDAELIDALRAELRYKTESSARSPIGFVG